MRDRTRERDQPVEPFADFLHQREGAEHAGMPAGSRSHGDQPRCTLFDRLVRKAVVDHVMHGDPAPSADRVEHFLARAERGDDHRHLPFGAGLHVGIEPVVRFVDDLVDRIGRGRAIGIVAIMRRQFLGDLVQPFVDLALRPRIQRGEAADNARLALRDDQLRPGYDEQRRSDDGDAQFVEGGGQGHGRRAPRWCRETWAYGAFPRLSRVTLRQRQVAGRTCSIS